MTNAATAKLRTLELKKSSKPKAHGCCLVKMMCRMLDAPAPEPKKEVAKKPQNTFVTQFAVIAMFTIIASPLAIFNEYQNTSSEVHKTIEPLLVQAGFVVKK